jgi:hypothetical protein
VEYINLEKEEKGLGFSILDYQVMHLAITRWENTSFYVLYKNLFSLSNCSPDSPRFGCLSLSSFSASADNHCHFLRSTFINSIFLYFKKAAWSSTTYNVYICTDSEE